ncbi:NAD-dependent epimerase/dehydratase family protein [Leptospira sp. GIMC2001]|uniref:NAD-dependent epimerase/dehydratase family protein n=1 Tax=Leptospira sp. GIMC2001 TaxID=1513297 RepID=UPI00234A62D2|nr:NAD-dependent epimerase/dehydratase family protein [Leptospira sp. GIMC2001]WCL51268.1 NAD-dependent epimerase/dehydratase family protein [Leptospira sp. GIMC2001]
MNILITGGAGFIGSHLCDKLLSENHNVFCIDNLSLGKMENINHLIANSNFRFEKVEMLNDSEYEEIFKNNKFDIVFHLAANSDISISHSKPSIDLEKTFLTTYRTLDLMRKYNVNKLFFASTSAIYGETLIPITESYGPLVPKSHYGAGKLASEAFIYSFSENYNIQTWVTRFPNVVGGRATHGAIFDFIYKLTQNSEELLVLGDGTQEKPYLYVKDVVDAMYFILMNSSEQVNIYNIGVESKTTVREIAEMVIKASKSDAKIKYSGGNRGWIGDVPKFDYNIDKLSKLGWKSARTSNESVWQAVIDNI